MRKVFTIDILTVNGNTVRVDHMEADEMPGDIITVKRQPDTVAGIFQRAITLILRRQSKLSRVKSRVSTHSEV